MGGGLGAPVDAVEEPASHFRAEPLVDCAASASVSNSTEPQTLPPWEHVRCASAADLSASDTAQSASHDRENRMPAAAVLRSQSASDTAQSASDREIRMPAAAELRPREGCQCRGWRWGDRCRFSRGPPRSVPPSLRHKPPPFPRGAATLRLPVVGVHPPLLLLLLLLLLLYSSLSPGRAYPSLSQPWACVPLALSALGPSVTQASSTRSLGRPAVFSRSGQGCGQIVTAQRVKTRPLISALPWRCSQGEDKTAVTSSLA